MSARDDYPIMNDLTLGRFGAHASREINAALNEIDRLRADAHVAALIANDDGCFDIVMFCQECDERPGGRA